MAWAKPLPEEPPWQVPWPLEGLCRRLVQVPLLRYPDSEARVQSLGLPAPIADILIYDLRMGDRDWDWLHLPSMSPFHHPCAYCAPGSVIIFALQFSIRRHEAKHLLKQEGEAAILLYKHLARERAKFYDSLTEGKWQCPALMFDVNFCWRVHNFVFDV